MKILAISLLILGIISTPIPPRKPGYLFGNETASSKIDVFFDPHCPDSKDFYSILKEVASGKINDKKVLDNLEIRVHYQALPFHRNSFLAIKVLKFLQLSKDFTKYIPGFLEKSFSKIDFYTRGTTRNSKLEVQKFLRDDLISVVGKDFPEFNKIFADTNIEIETRLEFKHGASRGVGGAPFLFVNDVLYEDVPENKNDLIKLLSQYI